MTLFSDEVEADEIYFRDRWQFEQKADFIPKLNERENLYTQEFYFFIPNALLVTPDNYTKENFFRDQTNLIRFKTPLFTLDEVADIHFPLSPLRKIWLSKGNNPVELEKELKLIGNVVRSAIRTRLQYLNTLLKEKNFDSFKKNIENLLLQLKKFESNFSFVEKDILSTEKEDSSRAHFAYVRLFITETIQEYLLKLIEQIDHTALSVLQGTRDQVAEFLLQEYPQEPLLEEEAGETIIYRKGLLNKYVLDALLLQINRFSPTFRYRNVIGAIAAGVAMLFFFVLFVWQGQVFVHNTELFILVTVILYILKDRLKEGLKNLFSHQRLGLFSDYTTKIMSPDGKHKLGLLKEKFSYLTEKEIQEDIRKTRALAFHSVLETFKRPETILYYKRSVAIFQKPTDMDPRRFMFNLIFRFNIRHFMDKASNPFYPLLHLNPEDEDLVIKHLPKVYHINIIMKTTIEKEGDQNQIELKKYRIVADKNGIKRLEYL